jgi:hypothetical protein
MAVSIDPNLDNPDLRGDHPPRLFAVALPYDRDHASDGYSRYGVYLAQEQRQFEPDSHVLDHAVTAWRLARPPIMAPGFVWSASRVIGSKLWVDEVREVDNEWRSAVRASIDVAYQLSSQWASWQRRDWERDYAGTWREPDTTGPVSLCSVRYVATLPVTADSLPPIPNVSDGRALTDWAHDVVGQLVDALNVTFAEVTDAVRLVPVSAPAR